MARKKGKAYRRPAKRKAKAKRPAIKIQKHRKARSKMHSAKAHKKAKPYPKKHAHKIITTKKSPMPKKTHIGTVEHFFTDISVGVIKLDRQLKVGDRISIEGATTNFRQKVESIQINRVPVKEAHKGDSVGLKVKGRVREKDDVYLAS